MYWRKANHIHAWFVNNVQDGEDDCGNYHVSEEKLTELLAVCKKVLEGSELVDGKVLMGTLYRPGENPVEQREPGKVVEDATTAKELLPRQEGFFFGGNEYDEFYIEDVKATANWAARMLADSKAGVPGSIYYSSSW